MKIEFHIQDVVITDSQKALIELKLSKLKRYIKDEPLLIDVYLTDQSGGLSKGGVDKSVRLAANFSNEKIFIEEIDSNLMRAFAYSFRRIEHQMQEFHAKRIGKGKTIPRRITDAFNFFFRKR